VLEIHDFLRWLKRILDRKKTPTSKQKSSPIVIIGGNNQITIITKSDDNDGSH